MPNRHLLQPGRVRTPMRDDFVASIPVYTRRAVMIFFLLPAAFPMGALAIAGHFSFQGMTQALFTNLPMSGSDPGVIRIRDCPPPNIQAGPIAHQCEHAPLKDVPLAIAAVQGGHELQVLYEMVVILAMGFYVFSAPSAFDARGRFVDWMSRLFRKVKPWG